MIFKKQFRAENPQTEGETDSNFDLSNYNDWLEEKMIMATTYLKTVKSVLSDSGHDENPIFDQLPTLEKEREIQK